MNAFLFYFLFIQTNVSRNRSIRVSKIYKPMCYCCFLVKNNGCHRLWFYVNFKYNMIYYLILTLLISMTLILFSYFSVWHWNASVGYLYCMQTHSWHSGPKKNEIVLSLTILTPHISSLDAPLERNASLWIT